MGFTEKITSAKKSTWLSEGFSEAEIKTTVELAKISAQIERCRKLNAVGWICICHKKNLLHIWECHRG